MLDPEPGSSSTFHLEEPEVESEAWQHLLALIDQAVLDGRRTFAPGHDMPPELWRQISVLPAEIGRLERLTKLLLYGSNLVAIPPQIGEMTALEIFQPYTSHRLHWYPYEITRCTALVDSSVSTRVLYGNVKTRAPFPQLPVALPSLLTPDECSVCRSHLSGAPIQRWISLKVATDVLPLLVHACSQTCIDSLRPSAPNHVAGAHRGGPSLRQPDPR